MENIITCKNCLTSLIAEEVNYHTCAGRCTECRIAGVPIMMEYNGRDMCKTCFEVQMYKAMAAFGRALRESSRV